MTFKGKALIISAPSGAGKTTLVKRLLQQKLPLGFSVSATSRKMRPGEREGMDYYFLSPENFRTRIQNGEFLEWEEVYENQFYGTLKSEIHRLWNLNLHVIFDVDVKGGINIKKHFGSEGLLVFIMPPSLEVLKARLESRGTETQESLQKRIAKAGFELGFADAFDARIINDELDRASEELNQLVRRFIDD